MQQLEKDLCRKIFTGEFGADMKVNLLNDGPITIFIDTKQRMIYGTNHTTGTSNRLTNG